MRSRDPARIVGALPHEADVAVVRDGTRTVVAVAPDEVVRARGTAALKVMATLAPGWWAGSIAYELGHAIEPVRRRRNRGGDPATELTLARFAARLVLDPTGRASVEGGGPGRELLERALSGPCRAPHAVRLGRASSSMDRDEFAAGVRAIRGLLEAGECYQVNLTRRLHWCERPDPVALHAALVHANPAPHGSLVRIGGRAVVSASPERFLRWGNRAVETRPVKGTAVTAGALRRSEKDRAENVMIVDLARNDLGRVCEPGTMEVPELCGLERHPGLHHLVSTVRGRLRTGVDAATLLRATFPPASVTGAPKPRVLQAIEDLEPVPREAYCGAVGWIDTSRGAGDLAVAIRTFTVDAGGTSLGVGAGIVADSDPGAEWAETELKAARLLRAVGAETGVLAGARG